MDGLRKAFAVFANLEIISSPFRRRWICSTPYSSCSSKIAISNPPNTDVLENSSICSKDLTENPKMSSLLEITSKLGIRFDNLISCFKISPELINESPTAWENCFKEVTAYGFSKKNFMRMITMYPQLFKIVKNEELGPAMANWMNCNLGYEYMLDLLSSQPQFLSVPGNELSARIPLLMAVTKSSGKNVVKLLLNCPSVIHQDWRDVREKIDYIEYVMKIDISKENLSKCYALNRSLDQIRRRHIFLERAGIYIRPKKVKGTKLELEQQPWSKNPRLAKITDTNDKVFMSEVARGLSLEELEVFQEMYEEEVNEESGNESEDD